MKEALWTNELSFAQSLRQAGDEKIAHMKNNNRTKEPNIFEDNSVKED